jgi:hypothetical protein
LATSLAALESHSGSEQIVPADQSRTQPRARERALPLLLVSSLTLFALAIDGYHPYAEDGGLYLAGVLRLLDPSLYPHATAFVLEPMRHSLFAPTVAAAVRLTHLSLPIVLLALHLASIWATLFAAWMLAARCWPSRRARAGAVVLLACWLALPIAGTALLFMDPYATARSLSTPAMVLALVGALDSTALGAPRRRLRGLLLCAAGLVLAAAMHPLMAAYALGATLMLLFARAPKRTVRLYATAALAAAALACATVLQSLAPPESAAYIRVALTRTYWFPAQWRWYELAGLAAPLAILAFFAWSIRVDARQTHISESRCGAPGSCGGIDCARALARMAIAVGATSWLIAALFARATAPTHLIARLQPLRAFQVVYLVLVLALGATLGERLLRRIPWRWAAAVLLLGGITFAVARSAFPNSNHMELPGTAPRNLWAQAFLWARDNTPKDALFALDADYINAPGEDAQCFRAIAQRSALADYSKDGGEASIAPGLAAEWVSGQAAQQALSAPTTTDAQRLSALRSLGVSWVVLQSSATTRFDCPYANSAVKLCRLP